MCHDAGMREIAPELLRPAVQAARAVLADLADDEVPARLHRVATRTGRSLPPPLARRLVAELDDNEWFRARVAEAWSQLDVDSAEGPVRVSSLFLVRPDGWADVVEGHGAAHAARELERVQATHAEQIDALKSEVDRAKRRAKRAQRDAEMAVAEAERRIVAARASAASIRDDEREELRKLRAEAAELRGALQSVESDAQASRERLRIIRAELLRARREHQPPTQPPARAVWGDLSALDAARLLDEVRMALSPDHEPVEETLPLETEPLALPAGVSPDGAPAIDWLCGVDRSLVVVVDGYNVIHLLEGGGPERRIPMADARRRLNAALADLQRAAVRSPHVIVVYDSSQPGGTTRETGPGNLEVRFTADGHIADEEILLLATELGGRGVVISTDRRVREGAERVGALGMWSQALAEWIRTR